MGVAIHLGTFKPMDRQKLNSCLRGLLIYCQLSMNFDIIIFQCKPERGLIIFQSNNLDTGSLWKLWEKEWPVWLQCCFCGCRSFCNQYLEKYQGHSVSQLHLEIIWFYNLENQPLFGAGAHCRQVKTYLFISQRVESLSLTPAQIMQSSYAAGLFRCHCHAD